VTHHGRAGGRLLEVALTLVLVALSVGLLSGFVALISYDFGMWGNGRDYHRDFGAALVKSVVFVSLAAAACLLTYLWGALLHYYRYDPRTLRPLTEKDSVKPGDGQENNEG
jgi:ABC-type Fe3+ transport system permease subunit